MGGACRLLLIYKPGLVVSQTPKLQINKYSLTAECCCAKCWRNCAAGEIAHLCMAASKRTHPWKEPLQLSPTTHNLQPPTTTQYQPTFRWLVIAGTWLLEKVQIYMLVVCVLSQRVQNARAESFCYFDLYSLSSFTRLKAFQPRVLFCMPYW